MFATIRRTLLTLTLLGCAGTETPQATGDAGADAMAAPEDVPTTPDARSETAGGLPGDTSPEITVTPPIMLPGGPAEGETMIIDNGAWQPVALEADPFAVLAPRSITCEDKEHGNIELSGMSVYFFYVNECEFLTVSQPLKFPVAAGTPIRVWMGHATMYSFKGLVTVQLAAGAGDAFEPLWTLEVTAPRTTFGSHEDLIYPERDLEAGETLYLNVRVDTSTGASKPGGAIAHGDSEWWFVSLSAPLGPL